MSSNVLLSIFPSKREIDSDYLVKGNCKILSLSFTSKYEWFIFKHLNNNANTFVLPQITSLKQI